jgi:hypothetical protein
MKRAQKHVESLLRLESPRSSDDRTRPCSRHRFDGNVRHTVVDGLHGARRETDQRLDLPRCSIAHSHVAVDAPRCEALRETLAATHGRHWKLIDGDR